MRTLLHIIVLLLLVNSAQAKEVFEASKTFKFTYQAAHLSMYSSFGTVKITTWSRPDIEITVKVTGRAYKQQDADEIIKTHGFVEKVAKDGSKVNLCDWRGPMFNNGVDGVAEPTTGNNGDNLQMDYEVHIPTKLALHLQHKHGKVHFTNDYHGDMTLEMFEGYIVTDAGLWGNCYMKFFNHTVQPHSSIANVRTATIDKPWDMELKKAGAITLMNAHNTTVKEADMLILGGGQWKLRVNKARQVAGNIGGSDVKLGAILESINLRLYECDSVVLDMKDCTANTYIIDASFSNITVRNCTATDLLIDTFNTKVVNMPSTRLWYKDKKRIRRQSGSDFPYVDLTAYDSTLVFE